MWTLYLSSKKGKPTQEFLSDLYQIFKEQVCPSNKFFFFYEKKKKLHSLFCQVSETLVTDPDRLGKRKEYRKPISILNISINF